jgi:adenylate kinase
MRLVFLGPPGAGKGTQAKRYAAENKLPHVSTGDMLREAVAKGTPAGKLAKPIMDAGGLVGDDIVLACVEERLEGDAKKGFILDGYPRNVKQAGDLEKALAKRGMRLDAVLNLDIPIDVIVPRMAGRRVALKSGRTYHIVNNPPKVPGKCDETGEDLIQRPDDREEVVRERMRTYLEKTEPLIKHYGAQSILVTVDGNGGVDEVYGRIVTALGARRAAKA